MGGSFTDGASRHPDKLGPMRVAKASDVLADDLRERILQAEYTENTALPSERVLVEQTRMSRTTVREALRILEVQGLVVMRSGRAGGAFVRLPGQESVADSVSLVIRGRAIALATLYETRQALEASYAALAARYRTDGDLEALEAANIALAAETGGPDDFLQADVDWHLAVAVASHNELLTGFMLAICRAIRTSTDTADLLSAKTRQTIVRDHRGITRAIRDGDSDTARRRMDRHLHAYGAAQEFGRRLEMVLPA